MASEVHSQKKERLYTKHLQVISGVKFTFREIDIISCLLHNRGEKKIGSMLDISHRTVSSHTRNVMAKIGTCSRDGVIDFIEKSGKPSFLREYYFCLVSRAMFDRSLQKITTLINRQSLDCGIFFSNVSKAESLCIESIISDLKHANINTHINIHQAHNLYVISKEPKLYAQNKDQKDINIVIDEEIDLNLYQSGKYVDFSKELEYYTSMINLVSQIIDHDGLKEITEEFTKSYSSIKEMQQGNLSEDQDQLEQQGLFTQYPKYIIFIVFLIFTLAFYINNNSKHNISVNSSYNVSEINDSLAKYIDNFSADNINKKQISQNHNIAKTLEKIVALDNIEDVKQYFSDSTLPSNYLTNYLYNLQALASYYMNNYHDGDKANQILFYAKSLMETYVNSRSSVINNFDNLEPEEILSELRIIKDFPEIYTRIIYSLARSYIYTKADFAISKKYFRIARYLGNNLNLLEGYMSDASGLLLIKKMESETKPLRARKKMLIEIIEGYKDLDKGFNSSTIYIKDFIPNHPEQKAIDITLHPYSIFDRFSRIIASYGQLMNISDDKSEQEKIIELLIEFLDITNKKDNVSEILIKIPQKKFADFCNNLGMIYLILHKHNLESPRFNQSISSIIDITSQVNYQISEELFFKAKKMSRNTDFTKADAYYGLMKLYKHELASNKNLDDVSSKILENSIIEMSKKGDDINSALNR